ncbi:zinc finger protein 271-like isoform X2 [Thunnus albacares]|uniref:zinc finger protein 271-like isoform X2 n=1 Tax=Thunnus albacares TaxID=8236 RepID=UPI001CF6766F|nr:zinc finger protein 271-like isoform X2 [Thunnus albacares]
MSSVECLRELINERLTAAAEEIFVVFQKTIVEYEDEIDRQRRLLDIVWKPEIKLHRIELPQHVCKEEEVLVDQQLCNQERNSSLDQEDPEPPQIKQEQEELYTSLDAEQVVLKQETETFMLTPTFEEGDNNKDQTLDLSPDETHNSNVAASQDRKGGKHEDSGSTRNAQLKPNKRLDKSKSHIKNEDNSTSLKIHSNTYTGKKSLKCDSCGKTFKCKSKLHTHMRVHTGEKPFSCNTCGRRFSEKAKVNRHMRTHTGEKPHSCNSCEKRFSRLGALKVHMRVHTELPQHHVCKVEKVLADQQLCNQERNSSLDQEDREPPQIKEEQEEPYTSLDGEQLVLKQETGTFMLTATCEESDNGEDQILDLSPVETQSAAEKEHVVSMSVKSSVVPDPNSVDQLLSHISHLAESQDHIGGKQGDSGSTRNAETKAQKRHDRSKNHTSNEDSSTTLKIHSNTYIGKRCFKCHTCGKSFKCKYNLQTHLRFHTGERPYPCNTCEKRFSQPSDLKLHMRVHTGEKPYPCNTCGKGFCRMADLKTHMRIHTGEKPYPCNICWKRFSDRTTVKRHIRTHTGEKPYPCNTCGKRFGRMAYLKNHIRVHTGEKPYPCDSCEKRFSELGILKVHMKIHTGEKPYNCETCGKDFRLGHQLKIHMRTHTVGKDSVRCQT